MNNYKQHIKNDMWQPKQMINNSKEQITEKRKKSKTKQLQKKNKKR